MPVRFDLSTLLPNYRAIFSNPMAKYCFGAVFLEGVFLFGVFPYMAEFLRTEGESRASIAGIVIAGFGIGGVVYTFMVGWLLEHFRANANSWLPWPGACANFTQFGSGGERGSRLQGGA